MRNNILVTLLFITLFANINTKAQTSVYDTINIMSYNVLDYGMPNTVGCPALNSPNKHEYLKTIVMYKQPDILGLVKMASFPTTFCTDTVIKKVLDTVCPGCYAHVDYTNLSGYEKTNMLYYKKAKFAYVSTTPLYYADNTVSDICIHKFFYKDTNLVYTHDTTYLSIILIHLQSGASNAASRATEITAVMNWLNANVTTLGNYMFMGDFNTQTSSEACYQSVISSPNIPTLFFDPVESLGNWVGTPTLYANYLTQSTRVTDPGDCGATGGMDNWFDHIMVSEAILYGSKNVQYVADSYTTIGQDGQHTLGAINGMPTNTSVPTNVLNALYYMSSHLPLSTKLAFKISSTYSINDKNNLGNDVTIFPNPVNDFIMIRFHLNYNKNIKIKLINTLGITVKELFINKNNFKNELRIKANDLTKGIYFIKITDDSGNAIVSKKIVKE